MNLNFRLFHVCFSSFSSPSGSEASGRHSPWNGHPMCSSKERQQDFATNTLQSLPKDQRQVGRHQQYISPYNKVRTQSFSLFLLSGQQKFRSQFESRNVLNSLCVSSNGRLKEKKMTLLIFLTVHKKDCLNISYCVVWKMKLFLNDTVNSNE